MSSIINNVDLINEVENIIITDPKKDKETGQLRAAFLHKRNNQANTFAIETTPVKVAFSPTYYGENNKDSIVPEENRNYSFVTSPNGGTLEIVENTKNFMNSLKKIKTDVVDPYYVKHSLLVSKKKVDAHNKDVMIETSVTYSVKENKQKPDGTFYDPNITVKINKKNGLPDLSLFIEKNGVVNQVEVTSFTQLQELLPRGTICKMIIRLIISFVNKSMHVSFRLVQLKIYAVDKLTIPKTYAFSDTPMVKNESSIKSDSSDTDEVPDKNVFGIGETVVVESDEEIDVENA